MNIWDGFWNKVRELRRPDARAAAGTEPVQSAAANALKTRNKRSTAAVTPHKTARLRKKLLRTRLVQWGLVGVLLILGSLCITLYEGDVKPKPWPIELTSAFLLELGIAVIVACVLAGTLEYVLQVQAHRQHQTQLRRIKKDTLRALFHKHVEPELYDELVRNILWYTVRRKDFRVLYQFEPHRMAISQEGEGLVKLTVTVSYKVYNPSRQELRHHVYHYFNKLLPGADQEYTSLKISGCTTQDGEENPVWTGQALRTSVRSEAVRTQVETWVFIGPRRTAQVEFTYMVVKRATDVDVWLSREPADGFRVTAVIDSSLGALRCWPESVHWLKAIEVINVRQGGPRVYEWWVNGVVLPNQGIMVYWRAEEGASSGAPAPAATPGSNLATPKA
jgi:hypothetical protein